MIRVMFLAVIFVNSGCSRYDALRTLAECRLEASKSTAIMQEPESRQLWKTNIVDSCMESKGFSFAGDRNACGGEFSHIMSDCWNLTWHSFLL